MSVRNRFAELHTQITAWRRGLHEHPEYDVTDDVIPTRCSYWVTLAEQRLSA